MVKNSKESSSFKAYYYAAKDARNCVKSLPGFDSSFFVSAHIGRCWKDTLLRDCSATKKDGSNP
jgi:hypothetical protein